MSLKQQALSLYAVIAELHHVVMRQLTYMVMRVLGRNGKTLLALVSSRTAPLYLAS